MDFYEDIPEMPMDYDDEYEDGDDDYPDEGDFGEDFTPLAWTYSYVWVPAEPVAMNELGSKGWRVVQGTMRARELGGMEVIQILMENMTCL